MGRASIDIARDQLGEVPTAFLEQDKFLFDTYRALYDETIAELLSRRDVAQRDQRNALFAAIVGSIAVTVGPVHSPLGGGVPSGGQWESHFPRSSDVSSRSA